MASNPAPVLLKRLLRHVALQGRTILDVGCGFGEFLLEADQAGARVAGIDVDLEAIKVAHALLRESGSRGQVCCAGGEALPFASGSFDVVVSNYALEHVQDPERVMQEVVRVLRVGGYGWLNVPNYIFPWEGHYGLVWPPLLPKALGRFYVRLRGMNPRYLDSVHYLTWRRLRRLLARLPIRIISNLLVEVLATPELIEPGWRRHAATLIRHLRAQTVAAAVAPDISLLFERTER